MVFIETVIHGVFFPSDGHCEEFRSFKECTADQSKVLAGRTVCNWIKKERKCETAPTPADVLFTLLMALIVLVLMKPVEELLAMLQEALCEKRPRLEELDPRLITAAWLGSIHHPTGLDQSPLALAVLTKQSMDVKNGTHGHCHEEGSAGQNLHVAATVDDGDDFESVRRHFEMHGSDEENAHLAHVSFTHLSSPAEEMRHILDNAQRTLQRRYALSSTPVFLRDQAQVQAKTQSHAAAHPQSHSHGPGPGPGKKVVSRRGNVDYSRESLASARAIEQQLGIYADGTLAPLTLWQRLRYGSREALLIGKIAAARKKAKRIVREVSEIEVPDSTLRDIALIREFIMENVAFAYRIALRRKFEEHEYSLPETISPFFWALGWLINVGTIGFFLYWVLAWGIINTGKNLDEWGHEYIVILVQDICVIECAKILFCVAFALISVRPQMHVIRQVINEAALSYIQYGADDADDISIVQHFSPACRTAHAGKVRNLAAAAVLRQITDADYERCQFHKGFSISRIALYIMIITATIASLDSFLAEQAVEIGLQSVWSAWLAGNAKLAEWNTLVTILVFGIGGPLFIYYTAAANHIIDQARNRMQQERLRRVQVESRYSRYATRQTHVGTARERFVREARRAWRAAVDAVVSLHYLLSLEYWQPQATRRAHTDAVWEGLNRYALIMGTTGSGASKGRATVEAASRHGSMRMVNLFQRQVSTFAVSGRAQAVSGNIPPEVLAMRHSGVETQWELDNPVSVARGETWLLRRVLGAGGLEELRGDTYFAAGAANEVDAIRDEDEQPVLYQRHARLSCLGLDVTTDKHVALRHILARLLGLSSHRLSGVALDSYENTGSLMVSEHELLEQLAWVFTVYHPCRLPLASGEVIEVLELHRAWHAEVGVMPAVGAGSVARVYFTQFEGWFLRLCAAIERLRVSSGVFEDDPEAAATGDGGGAATTVSFGEPPVLSWSRTGTADGKVVEFSIPAAEDKATVRLSSVSSDGSGLLMESSRIRLKPIPVPSTALLATEWDWMDSAMQQGLKQRPLATAKVAAATDPIAVSSKVAIEAAIAEDESPAPEQKHSVLNYHTVMDAILDSLLPADDDYDDDEWAQE